MRLATRTPAEGRQERLDRRRRDRAAARALREAYPGVQQLRLNLHFDGAKNVPASQSHELHPPAQAFFEFPCPFADCDGQFDLHDAVGAALRNGERRGQGEILCTGDRARDHASKQSCGLRLFYEITALYQDP